MINEAHYRRVAGMIEVAKGESGLELLCGGGGGQGGGGGWFIEPTVFRVVGEGKAVTRIEKEEVFGPCLTVRSFKEEGGGVGGVADWCNDSEFGLGAGIVCRDERKARELADELECGNVWINNYNCVSSDMCFGGVKGSGWGREGGLECIACYTYAKCVYVEGGGEGAVVDDPFWN